jgi:hypothetical protein
METKMNKEEETESSVLPSRAILLSNSSVNFLVGFPDSSSAFIEQINNAFGGL